MESIINVFKIKDLRQRILITLALVAVYRLGTFVTLPGIDSAALEFYFKKLTEGDFGKFVGMINMFSGGGLRNATVFALGIMPYISASIIFQMLTQVIPALEAVSKEGPSGRRKISQWTRYATIGICMIQATFLAVGLQSGGGNSLSLVAPDQQGISFVIISVMTLTAGTAFLMWLGEQITAFGITNGISMIIMASIISSAPVAVVEIASNFSMDGSSSFGPGKLAVLVALFFLIVYGVVAITQAQRRVPVQQAKVSRVDSGNTTYLPLRVNHAGVIPIIFAQALLIVPAWAFNQLLPDYPELFGMQSFLYNTAYVVLIIFFCFFYTAIIFNPKEIGENMKQNGSFIPGIRPGKATADFLEYIMTRITFAGAIFFAAIAIMPLFMIKGFNVSYAVTGFFGGTGLLIVVGVGLDVIQKIESMLVTHHYDGFMGNSRVRGRI